VRGPGQSARTPGRPAGRLFAPAASLAVLVAGLVLIGTFTAQYTAPAGDTSDVAVRLLLSSQGHVESVSTFTSNADGTATAGVPLQNGGRLTPFDRGVVVGDVSGNDDGTSTSQEVP
jgi:hypothetical protein